MAAASGGVSRQRLCALEDLADGGARGFRVEAAGRHPRRVFVIRRGETVYAYRDACPHMGVPLPWGPDAYLTPDARFIRCASHGALFRIESGECVSGPCRGESLRPERALVLEGVVWLKS